MDAQDTERIRALYHAGRTCGQIVQELGISSPLVDWSLWLRGLPADRATKIVNQMAGSVVAPYGKNGLLFLESIGVRAEAV